MKFLRVYADTENGKSVLEEISLPCLRLEKDVRSEDLKKRKRPLVPLIETKGCRFQHTLDECAEDWAVAEYRHIVFIVSGQVELSVGDGNTTLLQSGDMYLAEDFTGKGHRTRRLGDCRTFHLSVADPSWKPEGSKPLPSDYQHTGKERPNLKRMYMGDDGESYFRNFDVLFADTSGNLSPFRPSLGFYFLNAADGFFYDWHPEGINNFCFMMQGAMELEVAGGKGAIEVFGPGDVCLAEDRVGHGHIDRMHGEVWMVVILFATENLW